jgi:F-type H+-transporting ATPase subunit a
MTTPLLAAVEYGGEFEVPPVGELFNFRPVIELGGLFDINRVVLITFTAVLAAMLLFSLAFRRPQVVPGKLQNIAETMIGFVRDQIALDVIGPEGRRFVPLLTTLFIFILFNNLFEIIPLVNFPPTSRIALPMFLALISWLVFLGVGIRSQGPIRYFRDIAFPPGVPKPIYILLTPIEIVTNIFLRPFTLMIRLFANMVAGHILLTIVFITIHVFLAFRPGLPIGILVLLISPLAVGFELFVAVLQAYIFTILTAVYISGSLHPEH